MQPLQRLLPSEYAADGAVLTVYPDRVVISRKGPADGAHRVREIPLGAIREVRLKRPGMTPGYLYLGTAKEHPPGTDLAYRAAGGYPPDTLLLSRKHYPAFEEAEALLRNLLAAA